MVHGKYFEPSVSKLGACPQSYRRVLSLEKFSLFPDFVSLVDLTDRSQKSLNNESVQKYRRLFNQPK